MHPLCIVPCFSGRLNLVRSLIPSFTQVRWRKIPKRKPKWLPTAPSKLYRISEHRYETPDEIQAKTDLLEEYFRKCDSLRKLFQEELKQNTADEAKILEEQRKEEERFKILLEENKKENERIKAIREKVLEERFQAKVLEILQLEDERKTEIERAKLKVEEIVREAKVKAAFITEDKLDQVIEHAIDNPININFAISLDGSVKWESTPPPEYEAEIKKRIAKGLRIL